MKLKPWQLAVLTVLIGASVYLSIIAYLAHRTKIIMTDKVNRVGRVVTGTSIDETAKAIKKFHAACNELPNELASLLLAKSCWPADKFDQEHLKDGWGNPLRYRKIDNGFELTSLGSDGQEGGVDQSEDIAQRFQLN